MTSNAVHPANADCDQLDGLGTGASGRVVEQHVVFATGRRGELPLRLKWLSKHNLSGDHLCLS